MKMFLRLMNLSYFVLQTASVREQFPRRILVGKMTRESQGNKMYAAKTSYREAQNT